MGKHWIVCTTPVPYVRHIGLVCACGQVFHLDVGDQPTWATQVAKVREHVRNA